MKKYVSGNRLTQPRQNRFADRRLHSFGDPLMPPFNNPKDENPRLHYPPEGRLPGRLMEDISNYGRGGYYGNTYDQEAYLRERWNAGDRNTGGYQDSYRDLGDRRWSRDRERSRENAPGQRSGYRSMEERTATEDRHRGKGSRSYRRSDGRIHEDLNDRLYDDPFVNASDIETSVRDGEVILTGTVDDKAAKRRAEDIAEETRGVRNVENRLRLGSR